MNVIGFDDGPFERAHRGDVLLVGVVCAGTRVDGIVAGRIRRDGANAAREMIRVVRASQFGAHLQCVMLQGIAVGGFNVVDVNAIHLALRIPVLVVTRRQPDMSAVRKALSRIPAAERKWKLIEAAGALEPLGSSRRSLRRGEAARSPIWVQRIGLSLEEARRVVESTVLHGNIPEPLRLAHLIAGGLTTGKSRGRA